jgi:hypothetical protein
MLTIEGQVRSGLLKLLRLSRQYSTQFNDFPVLQLEEDDIEDVLPKLRTVKLRAELVQCNLLKRDSGNFVAELAEQVNDCLKHITFTGKNS